MKKIKNEKLHPGVISDDPAIRHTKSKYLPNESENFYKKLTPIGIPTRFKGCFNFESVSKDLYLNYSRFNLDWMDELEIVPKIIFDVGCNNGGDSIRFKQRWGNVQVHAFEADPDIGNLIKYYMKNEGIIFSNVGVSDEDGEEIFYPAVVASNRQVTCGAGTFIKSRVDESKINDHRIIFLDPIKIKTISLYTYCQENNIKEIDLLHTDAEGYELNIIKGLKNIRPKVIFAEQHNLILSKEQLNNFHVYMLENEYQLECHDGVDVLYIDKKL